MLGTMKLFENIQMTLGKRIFGTGFVLCACARGNLKPLHSLQL